MTAFVNPLRSLLRNESLSGDTDHSTTKCGTGSESEMGSDITKVRSNPKISNELVIIDADTSDDPRPNKIPKINNYTPKNVVKYKPDFNDRHNYDKDDDENYDNDTGDEDDENDDDDYTTAKQNQPRPSDEDVFQIDKNEFEGYDEVDQYGYDQNDSASECKKIKRCKKVCNEVTKVLCVEFKCKRLRSTFKGLCKEKCADEFSADEKPTSDDYYGDKKDY